MASNTLRREVAAQLAAHAPFSNMESGDVDFVATHARLLHFAPGECLIEAGRSPPSGCFIIREGLVIAAPPGQDRSEDLSESPLGPGDVFPVGSLLERRAPQLRYCAAGDVVCWVIPNEHFDALLERSSVFLDFCRRRLAALSELSRQAVQAVYATQAAQWRLMSQPLATMIGRSPVSCAPDTALKDALSLMDHERVGSILVLDEAEPLPVGILTLQDVIGRILLPGLSLEEPVSRVMSSPVCALPASSSVAEAVMLVAERRIRHVPILRDGRLIGVVTERDLFALQRRSHRQISEAIERAAVPDRLVPAAADIRQWARSLIAQGMTARHVTRLVSTLNDALTRRMVELLALKAHIDPDSFCWLAFGSEGREEQTIATDQDNGIVFDDTLGSESAARLLVLGAEVNHWLDRCGYPLCRGNIMAGNPSCTRSLDAWRDRFSRWIEHGNPLDLLNASIFFDLRPLAGRLGLGQTLLAWLKESIPKHPKFLKLLSDSALRNAPPLSLMPGVLGAVLPDKPTLDLKLTGTMPLVDGARLMALAHGIDERGTAQRFEALVAGGFVARVDGQAWVDAFEYLQGLRLKAQFEHSQRGGELSANVVRLEELSELDRRILKEALRQVRKLQQRLLLDYP